MAIKEALYHLKRNDIYVRVFSDSSYAIKACDIWSYDWERQDWKTQSGKEIKQIKQIDKHFLIEYN